MIVIVKDDGALSFSIFNDPAPGGPSRLWVYRFVQFSSGGAAKMQPEYKSPKPTFFCLCLPPLVLLISITLSILHLHFRISATPPAAFHCASPATHPCLLPFVSPSASQFSTSRLAADTLLSTLRLTNRKLARLV